MRWQSGPKAARQILAAKRDLFRFYTPLVEAARSTEAAGSVFTLANGPLTSACRPFAWGAS